MQTSNLFQISVNRLRKFIPRGWGPLLKSIAWFIPSLQQYKANLLNGDFIYVDLRENMCFGLFFDGGQPHEIGSEKLYRKILKTGDVVIDIGANIGYYTRLASNLVGNEGSVLAFEPMPAALRLLRMNCAELLNVTIFPMALCDTVGVGTFYIRKNGDTSSLNNTSGAKALQVKMSTADDILMKYKRIDFIKIDVEGFEMDVLNGAKKILDTYRPIVYFELLEGYAKMKNLTYADFDTFFKKFDYVLKYIDHSDSESILVSDKPENMVVAVPKDRMHLLK